MALLDDYLPVFKQVLRMIIEPEAFPDYEKSRQTCIALLEQAIYQTSKEDVCEEEKEAAQMAVIAWVDETVLRSELPWRQHWQGELLQRKYLGLTTAGEHFFILLSQLSAAHKQARKVFLFCLQQGFHGRYSTPDRQTELQDIITELRSMCLPEIWQIWPNETSIVPAPLVPTRTMSQRLHLLPVMSACVALLYTILFYFLHHYTF